MEQNRIAESKEQLFVLEVFVSKVNIDTPQINGSDVSNLGIDIQVINFPVFRLKQKEFLFTSEDRNREITRHVNGYNINFNQGKICMFVTNPINLAREISSQPILLDVYNILKIELHPYNILKSVLGRAQIPFSNCLCNQFNQEYDSTSPSEPLIINNTFVLLDTQRKPSGTIAVYLQLRNFKQTIMSDFAISDTTLLFKDHGSIKEFQCIELSSSNENDKENVFPNTQDLAGLTLLPKERIGELHASSKL